MSDLNSNSSSSNNVASLDKDISTDTLGNEAAHPYLSNFMRQKLELYKASVTAEDLLTIHAVNRACSNRRSFILLYKELLVAGLVSDEEICRERIAYCKDMASLRIKNLLDYASAPLDSFTFGQFTKVLIDYEIRERWVEDEAEKNLPLVLKNEQLFSLLFKDLSAHRLVKDIIELRTLLEDYRLFVIDQRNDQVYTPEKFRNIRNFLACL